MSKSLNKDRTPIFIHSLFRSGSTYLFNSFRRSSFDYWCYQEPLNEMLLHLNADAERLLEMSEVTAKSLRHPAMSRPYYWEYYQVRSELEGLIEKSFCYDDFFINEGESLPESQVRYFMSLISNAKGRPLLQFCRSLGRINGLKNEFGGVHIHLWRNPRSQWWSFKIINYFDNVIQLIYKARNLPPVLMEIKSLCEINNYHNDDIENEILNAKRHPLNPRAGYMAFYALWLFSYIEGEKHSNITINIDSLSLDKIYRENKIRELSQLNINEIDFTDCVIPQLYFTDKEQEFYNDIEDEVKGLFSQNGYEKPLINKSIKSYREQIRDFEKPDLDLVSENLLKARITALKFFEQKNETEIEIQQARTKINENNIQIQQLSHELQAVYNSHSWRITSFFRQVVSMLKYISQWQSNFTSRSKVYINSIFSNLFKRR